MLDIWKDVKKLNFRYFTITASQLIRHNAKKYRVSITSQGYDIPQTLEVAIRNSKKEGKIFEVVNNITLINGKTQNVEFDVSKVERISCLAYKNSFSFVAKRSTDWWL